MLMHLQHHITMDHATRQMMQDEIEAHLLGKADTLPAPLPFRNFVAQARLGVSQQEHANYFRQLLGDLEEPTAPFGLMKVRADGSGIEEARLQVDAKLAQQVRERARKLEVSTASVFHVAWAQVLAKISGREDVVFGTVLVGRMQGGKDSDRAMGVFINTLPVRLRIDEQEAEAVVRRAHLQLAELLWHEHASLALVQRCSAVSPPMPLFSTLLNYRHGRIEKQARSEERKRAREGTQLLLIEERTNYPCTFSVDDAADGFWLTAQVQSPIEPMRICEYMHTALASLMNALERAPGSAIGKLTVLPAKERQQLLYEWNATEVEYPSDKCVHELFEEQVEKTPAASAVVFEEEELSYAGLNRQANQLARRLCGMGIQPGHKVAMLLDRSMELIVAELAILKCGAVYVPIDRSVPDERKVFLIGDSEAHVLLTLKHNELPEIPEVVRVNIDLDQPILAEDRSPVLETNLGISVDSEATAYLMYTSGSTGTPKGVMVPHRAIRRLALNNRFAAIEAGDRVALAANPAFDATTLEIWVPLLNGARIVVISQEVLLDARRFGEALQRQKVSVLWLTVGLFNQYAEKLKEEWGRLRYLIVGGDVLDPATIGRLLANKPPQHLLNGYGPTETTTFAATYEIKEVREGRSIPIGRPIANTRIYILDAHGEPVPVGVAGELYIGGAGVARGYLNRPELTAEKFLKDPFTEDPDGRMYRTGDLGRWLADGNIEFLGRNDFQVKIRGFRIELGEIEARLNEHDGVREAVVLAREDTPGEKRLVAYYTTSLNDGSEMNAPGAEQLRLHLLAALPEYMVPAAYVRLESLPLTPNGKLDRKALPAPEGDAYGARQYEAPQGAIEELLASIWVKLLKVERVGRHDNFFELGGHSLMAVRVIARVREALKVEVAIRDLFAYPVLTDLARALESANSTELSPIVAVERGAPLPVSFAQQRLWFLAQMEGVSQAYHMPMGLRLKGGLDRAALRKTLDRIVARHEALRTIFAMVDGEPVQRIIPPEDSRFHLVEHDLRGQSDAGEELARLAAEEAEAGFDLEAGPLIRGRLIRLADEEDALLITMHHIVSDGWSMGVFSNELSTLYGAFVCGEADPLPALEIQYADYAVWQRKWMEGEILQQQAAYWKGALAGAPALLELPTDHPRPAQQDFAGALAKLTLDQQLTAGLKDLGRRHGATLYMTVLAGWAALLSRLSGQQDVVIGTPTANRRQLEVEGLIGFFVNTLAVRLELSGSPTVSELLRRQRNRFWPRSSIRIFPSSKWSIC